MKIIQLVYNTIPQDIIECMSTVKKYADTNNFEYEVITEIPQEYKGIENLRVISNYHRVDLLTTRSDIIFIDWDVKLKSEFVLECKDYPMFNSTGDVIMYSGDVKFWKKIRMFMGNINDHKYELNIIFTALRINIIDKNDNMIISSDNFTHLNYSKNKNLKDKKYK